VEDLVVRRLAPIAGVVEAEMDRVEVRALVQRVEIHAAAVHMILRTAALGARSRQRMSLDKIRRQLLPGEQITTEASNSGLVRVLLPVRLKLRGGRNWIVDPAGGAARAPSEPDRQLIRRLRAAHGILRACGAQPDASTAQVRYARAPGSSYKMSLARWAFLAPDIQEAILEGRRLGYATSPGRAAVKIPLLWSDQRSLFGMVIPRELQPEIC